jgi:pimeloyl-ACP methyl ester carboxylesterase
MMFAATYPDRVAALILYRHLRALLARSEGPTRTATRRKQANCEVALGRRSVMGHRPNFAPRDSPRAKRNDPDTQRDLARLVSDIAMSPGTGAQAVRAADGSRWCANVLPAIRVPTLILHRKDDQPGPLANGRYLAERIAGAKYRPSCRGADHLWLVRRPPTRFSPDGTRDS